MVRIRLRRVGLKNQPSYRIVVQDKEMPRDGRFLEIVGFYNPRTQPGTINIQEDRVFDWMSKGALPTESVAQLFKPPEPSIVLPASKKASRLKRWWKRPRQPRPGVTLLLPPERASFI
jgi:small subunit ribosomal protein S16